MLFKPASKLIGGFVVDIGKASTSIGKKLESGSIGNSGSGPIKELDATGKSSGGRHRSPPRGRYFASWDSCRIGMGRSPQSSHWEASSTNGSQLGYVGYRRRLMSEASPPSKEQKGSPLCSVARAMFNDGQGRGIFCVVKRRGEDGSGDSEADHDEALDTWSLSQLFRIDLSQRRRGRTRRSRFSRPSPCRRLRGGISWLCVTPESGASSSPLEAMGERHREKQRRLIPLRNPCPCLQGPCACEGKSRGGKKKKAAAGRRVRRPARLNV